MLPYRIKPPPAGGSLKRKKKKQKEEEVTATTTANNTLHSYVGGGPVQSAIEKDLVLLRQEFLQQMTNLTTTSATTNDNHTKKQHTPKGSCFRVFKEVFANAKMGLVHTHYVPPRSDKGQYSQLVYAACLSLIHKAFLAKQQQQQQQQQQSLAFLEQASFGLFCLYTLYETNPLPRGPSTKDSSSSSDQQSAEILEMVPMGLEEVDGTKRHFRRVFCSPIRIDRFHYSLLLQLREEALAQQADCQSQCMQAQLAKKDLQQQQPNSNDTATTDGTTTNPAPTTNNNGNQHRGWSCQCAMAIDTLSVIDRLWDHLELCEYTGPCSVEGLAGHAEYPFPSTKPASKKEFQDLLTRQHWKVQDRLSAEEIKAVVRTTESAPALATMDPEPILSDLQAYQSSLQSIRIPTNHLTQAKTKRFQEALQPILVQCTTETASNTPATVNWETLASRLKGKASFEAETSRIPTTTDGGTGAAMTRRQLRRHRHVTWATKGKQGDEQPSYQGGTAQARNEQAPQDDISIPLASSSTNNVVQQNMSYELVLPKELPASLQTGIQSALQQRLDRDRPIFLPSEEKAKQGGESANDLRQEQPILDDVSSIGFGGASLAQYSESARGGAALKTLIAKANKANADNNKTKVRVWNKRPSKANANSQQTKQNRTQDFLAMEYENLEFDDNKMDDGDDSDTSNLSLSDEEDAEEDAGLSVATSAVGRNALDKLLSTVDAKKKQASATKRTQRKRKRDAQQGSLPDDTSQATSVGAGNKALKALLSEANDEAAASDSDYEDSPPPRSRKRVIRKSKQPGALGADLDDASVATSSAGNEALTKLVAAAAGNNNTKRKNGGKQPSRKQAAQKPPPRKRTPSRQKVKKDDKSQLANDEPIFDNQSVASSVSGQGRTALHALLSHACQGEEDEESTVTSSRRRSTRKRTRSIRLERYD